MKRTLLISMALLLTTNAWSKPASQNPWRWNTSFLTGIRNGYIFPGSNAEKASQITLLSGKDFPGAGRALSLTPWGFEVDGSYQLGAHGGPFFTARVVPFALRVPGASEQSGVDWFVTGGYQVAMELDESTAAGFRLGFRARRWEIESGAFPKSGHAGLGVSAFLESQAWFAVAEAGLTAFNFGSSSSLGIQRDSSTLRLRGGYRLPLDSFTFKPGIEFFHTHRSFYASSLIAGESALFVDEVSLALVLGVDW